MGSPEQVTIGTYRYGIEYQDDPILDDKGRSCTGLISPESQTIYVKDNGRGLQRIQQTLVHEILHGIHHYRSFEPSACDGPTICDEFGRGFLLAARNNKQVIKWLMNIDSEFELAEIEEMPSHITVGAYQYTLRAKTSILRESRSVIVASDAERLLIEYVPHRGVDMIQTALLMEIIESIFDYRNFDAGKSNDTELIVDELASGLLLFIKQNHEFMSWLMSSKAC